MYSISSVINSYKGTETPRFSKTDKITLSADFALVVSSIALGTLFLLGPMRLGGGCYALLGSGGAILLCDTAFLLKKMGANRPKIEILEEPPKDLPIENQVPEGTNRPHESQTITSIQPREQIENNSVWIENYFETLRLGDDLTRLEAYPDLSKLSCVDGFDWKANPREIMLRCSMYINGKVKVLFLPGYLFVHNGDYAKPKQDGDKIEFNLSGTKHSLTIRNNPNFALNTFSQWFALSVKQYEEEERLLCPPKKLETTEKKEFVSPFTLTKAQRESQTWEEEAKPKREIFAKALKEENYSIITIFGDKQEIALQLTNPFPPRMSTTGIFYVFELPGTKHIQLIETEKYLFVAAVKDKRYIMSGDIHYPGINLRDYPALSPMEYLDVIEKIEGHTFTYKFNDKSVTLSITFSPENVEKQDQ